MALKMIIKHLKQIITLARQVAPLAKVLAKRVWVKSIGWLKENVEEALSWAKEILTSIYKAWLKVKGMKRLPKKEEVKVEDNAEREAAEERINAYKELVASMKTKAAMSESEEDESAVSEAASLEAASLVVAISEDAAEEDASEEYWRNYWCERSDPFTTGI